MTAAGLPVELRVRGTPRTLPPGMDLAAYRVIQEALTNVIKHAGQPLATVTLDYRDDALVIEVADDGRQANGRTLPRAPARRRQCPAPAAACSACGNASPCTAASWTPGQPGGGWRVRARFPRAAVRGRRPGCRQCSDAGSTPGQPAPRVLIADDQTLVRTGFRMILRDAGIPVVAEAADGAQAVAAALEHRPGRGADGHPDAGDGRPGGHQAHPRGEPGTDCRIIMLTTFDLDQYVYGALAAGASGFLLKHVSPEYLIAAIRMVRSGDALLAPSITRRLVERFAFQTSLPR